MGRLPLTPEKLASSGSEHSEQSALMLWAWQSLLFMPDLELLFAIPNGGMRGGANGSAAAGARMRAEGVKRGVPDLCLPIANRGFHSLFIELKRANGKPSDLSEEQRGWLDNLSTAGHCCALCFGWRSAAEMLKWYVGNEWKNAPSCKWAVDKP